MKRRNIFISYEKGLQQLANLIRFEKKTYIKNNDIAKKAINQMLNMQFKSKDYDSFHKMLSDIIDKIEKRIVKNPPLKIDDEIKLIFIMAILQVYAKESNLIKKIDLIIKSNNDQREYDIFHDRVKSFKDLIKLSTDEIEIKDEKSFFQIKKFFENSYIFIKNIFLRNKKILVASKKNENDKKNIIKPKYNIIRKTGQKFKLFNKFINRFKSNMNDETHENKTEEKPPKIT